MKWWRWFRKREGFVLVLGGGGARGFAHIGALRALEEAGLRPSAIVGVSVGALVGAMYARNPDAQALEEEALRLLESESFRALGLPEVENGDATSEGWMARLSLASRKLALYTRLATARAVADRDALIALVRACVGDARFADLAIPLHVVAVEFPSGEARALCRKHTADVALAVAASMALPGVFDPVEIHGVRYLDGGLAGDLPVDHAREVARGRPVVAVNVGARPDPKREPENVYEMLDWALAVRGLYLRRWAKREADAVIEPLPGFRQWNDFSAPEAEIERGYLAARKAMPRIKRLV